MTTEQNNYLGIWDLHRPGAESDLHSVIGNLSAGIPPIEIRIMEHYAATGRYTLLMDEGFAGFVELANIPDVSTLNIFVRGLLKFPCRESGFHIFVVGLPDTDETIIPIVNRQVAAGPYPIRLNTRPQKH